MQSYAPDALLLQELAALTKDPAEAARILAANGDYLAAAERCMASPNFLDRLTPGQLRQVHTWLLRVGTVEAARKAVELWEKVQQHGRLGEEIGESIAAAQLMLGRLLLREVVGAPLQPFDLKQAANAAAAAAAAAAAKEKAEAEREVQRREQKKEKKKLDKQKAKERKKQWAEGGTAAAGKAAEGDAEGSATAAAATVEASGAAAAGTAPASITTQGRSYAAAAGTAAAGSNAQAASTSSTSTTSAAQAAAAAATAALKAKAPIPTACLAKLPQILQEQPDRQDLVAEAIRHLSDAQAAFANCQQPAGVLEALSWSLAARPAADITLAQYQVAQQQGAGGEPDVARVVGQVKEATVLLQALASVTMKETGGCASCCGGYAHCYGYRWVCSLLCYVMLCYAGT
jgi:hypothetical protein